MMYRIAWESRDKGNSGRGGFIFRTVAEAQEVADNANKEWENIITHWVEKESERD